MTISWVSLFWLFFFYSFNGWCIEVCAAAVHRRKFVNRGFVTGPFCPIYGFGIALFEIFLSELRSSPVFLFLGVFILAALLEYFTGIFLEKVYKKKLWDYSRFRFNLDGYICLRYCLLWGVLGTLAVMYADSFIAGIFGIIPKFLSAILIPIFCILLLLDSIGSAVTTLNLQVQAQHKADWDEFTEEVDRNSKILENVITRHIQKRLQKSYPSISMDALIEAKQGQKKSTVFAEGCSFYKLVSLFFVGAFLGDIIETIFCRIVGGYWMNRSNVLYGPFSVVWGLACVFLTGALYRYREKGFSLIFFIGAVLGGIYEYNYSVFTEMAFGAVFWDYSKRPFNLGGRVNLLYCLFWGIATVIWLKKVYPKVSKSIEKIPKKAGTILCNILIVFMTADLLISGFAIGRYSERNNTSYSSDSEETDELDEFFDEYYPDEVVEDLYLKVR